MEDPSSLALAAFPPAAFPFPFFLPLPEAAVAAAFPPPPSSSEAAEDAEEAARDLELLRVASAPAPPPPDPEPESSESSSLRILRFERPFSYGEVPFCLIMGGQRNPMSHVQCGGREGVHIVVLQGGPKKPIVWGVR